MALALYRKYRPKKLADIIGQELVVEVLRNAARQNKIAHAYLFYGPRGTGKTTMARLVAKLANCETRAQDEKFRAEGEPCNQCNACEEIDFGNALDVIEIDAASNRGIDEIRSLREGARLAPTKLKHKVFIIDEAHQLTKEAFNALLKTLEEPPSHVIIILATTEAEKLPPTITSRMQRFHFKRLPIKSILEKLKLIAVNEKLNVDYAALELLAASSEGSLRDAESLLDQVLSLEGRADLQNVERILGKVGFIRTATLAEHLINGDLSKALEYLDEIYEVGFNLVQLNRDLIHYLRRVVVLKVDSKLETIFAREMTSDELKKVKEHSEKIDLEKGIALVKSLIRAYSEMRYSPFVIVPLEVAIIENLKIKG